MSIFKLSIWGIVLTFVHMSSDIFMWYIQQQTQVTSSKLLHLSKSACLPWESFFLPQVSHLHSYHAFRLCSSIFKLLCSHKASTKMDPNVLQFLQTQPGNSTFSPACRQRRSYKEHVNANNKDKFQAAASTTATWTTRTAISSSKAEFDWLAAVSGYCSSKDCISNHCTTWCSFKCTSGMENFAIYFFKAVLLHVSSLDLKELFWGWIMWLLSRTCL